MRFPYSSSIQTFLLAAALCGGAFFNVQAGDNLLREKRTEVMGTDLQVVAIGPDEAVLDEAIDAAINEMRRVEDVMTDWRASPLTDLNNEAGSGPVEVPLELAQIIARGLALGELTGGAFDITFAGAGRLWNFKVDPPVIPSDQALSNALARIGWARVSVDPEKVTVNLPEDMRLGLGGIAKGYGVDRAMQVLMDHGVKHGMVNAGGDLKALGDKLGEPWEIAIKHPRDRNRAMAVIRLQNSCVVTSGDYERFFVHEGQRYHHILDPRTGRPSTGCLSATVVAQNAEYADALATALCVMGPETGLELVKKLDHVEALMVGMDGQVTVSDGLQNSLL